MLTAVDGGYATIPPQVLGQFSQKKYGEIAFFAGEPDEPEQLSAAIPSNSRTAPRRRLWSCRFCPFGESPQEIRFDR